MIFQSLQQFTVYFGNLQLLNKIGKSLESSSNI